MNSRHKLLIEWGKIALILLLCLSAVYLVTQSALYEGILNLGLESKEKLVEVEQQERGKGLSVLLFLMVVRSV